jgi:hypothetical protein
MNYRTMEREMQAGWYPDPTGLPFERYWDGVQWVNQTRPLTAAGGQVLGGNMDTVPYGSPAAANAGLLSQRTSWYRRKPVIITGAAVATLLVIGGIGAALTPAKKKLDPAAAAVATSAAPNRSITAPATSAHAAPPTHARKAPVRRHTVVAVPDDGSFVMPNEVGKVLQDGQDDIQRVSGDPVFFSHSHDLLGDRFQILDRDWQICTQNIQPGRRVSAIGHIDFGVVKVYESCP